MNQIIDWWWGKVIKVKNIALKKWSKLVNKNNSILNLNTYIDRCMPCHDFPLHKEENFTKYLNMKSNDACQWTKNLN